MIDTNLEKTAMSAPAGRSGTRLQFSIGTPLADVEREAIVATLGHFQGNKRRCAEGLGISLKTLYSRLSEYNNFSGVVRLSVL